MKLGEILDYEQPTKYIVKKATYSDEFTMPVLTAGQSFILGYTNETNGIYKADSNNPCIIFDDFTTSFHWVEFPFKIKSSAMKILTPSLRGEAEAIHKKGMDCHDSANAESRNDEVNFRFVYYAMKCINFIPSEHSRHWIGKYSQFQIPIPPLAVQNEVVEILDRFDSLVNDISSGIPAQIKGRKMQYEYYREKLLTFKAL